jgi:PRTRC genetic system ThiF family protein
MSVHHCDSYITNPVHKVTVDLVGLGGTGSQMLNNLGRMNEALMRLGHPGLQIRAWDPDEVTTANMGRQLFSEADLGLNKSVVLVSRVNRFFGTEWQAIASAYNGSTLSNILITCVDTARTRIQLAEKFDKRKKLLKHPSRDHQPVDEPYYWLDIGNMQKTGQCLLGTMQKIKQPLGSLTSGADIKGIQFNRAEKCKSVLPNVVKKFPQLKRIKEENQGPSCSLAEALEKQDLFINSTLAQFGCNLLWKLIREGVIKYQGCYVNLETLSVNAIKI